MNNKQTTSIFIAMIATVSLIMMTPGNAEAVSYHTGKIWAPSTNSDHSNELSNGSIPFIIDKTRLSNNLDLIEGTTIQNVYTDINNAVSAWNATDLNLVILDNTTYYHDNKITSKNLPAKAMGSQCWDFHWKFDGLQLKQHEHFVKSIVYLNDDVNDYSWDHNGEEMNNGSYPKIVKPYKVVLHELGHSFGFCDTYNDAATYYDCVKTVKRDTAMAGYYFGGTQVISDDDKTIINGLY